jgi:putative hydrolase of the HAD superfamily
MIRHLLLDLDNTLYPASDGMDAGITRRMLEFVANYLSVAFDEGVNLRKDGLSRHGTTLEWLKTERGLTDETGYFAAVHPETEISELRPDPNLRPFLLSLGLPLTLLTNGRKHMPTACSSFQYRDIFVGIFDITWHKGPGKPHPESFLAPLKSVGFSVEETIFVDDHRNTRGATRRSAENRSSSTKRADIPNWPNRRDSFISAPFTGLPITCKAVENRGILDTRKR